MTIDDNWDIIDISDHCLITIQINIDKNNNKSTNKKTCIIFNKKSNNKIEKYTEYVFHRIGKSDQPINIEQFNNIIYEAEENTLKVEQFKNIKKEIAIKHMIYLKKKENHK